MAASNGQLDFVELAKAMAVPTAVVLVTAVILLVVLLVAIGLVEVDLAYKDFKFGAKRRQKPPPPLKELTISSSAEDGEAKIDFKEDIIEEVAKSSDTSSEARATFESLLTKDPDELDAAYEKFKGQDLGAQQDKDFWESWYANRRSELRGLDVLAEMTSLASKNTDWAWPLVHASRKLATLGKVDEAEAAMRQAVARAVGANRPYILADGVKFLFKFRGIDAAYAFVHEQLDAGGGIQESAKLLESLAEEIKVDGDVFSSALIREFALRYVPTDHSIRFNLAFSLAESDQFYPASYEHYERVIQDNEDSSNAYNNIGVIYDKADLPAAQNEMYVVAAEKGSNAAAANLIQMMVPHGMLKQSEMIAASIATPGMDDQLLIAAKNELAKAKFEADKKLAVFKKSVETGYDKYSRMVREALAYWNRTGNRHLAGEFEGSSGLSLKCSHENAECRVPLHSVVLVGTLPLKALCYEGTLKDEASRTERRVLVTPSATGDALVMVWPPKVGEEAFSTLATAKAAVSLGGQ